ncbi:13159_t:CDS:2 [Entrophospora sp. SA101]|nr:13159_t:CDS:2 [Entrophospora sp. SA101]
MSYFQSVTQKLAMGVETVYQKPTPDIEETSKSLVLKYSGNDYVTTVQWQEVGALQASYYQKINEKVDFGTELQIILAAGRREAQPSKAVANCSNLFSRVENSILEPQRLEDR